MSEQNNQGQNSNERDEGVFSKNNIKRAGVVLVVLLIAVGGVAFVWNPVYAQVTDVNDFVANGAEIISEDGSVSGLGFGNRSDTPGGGFDQDELTLQYEGFENGTASVPVNLTLEVRGLTSGEATNSGAGFSGPGETTYEEIANGTATFTPNTDGGGLAGEVNISWSDGFPTATENGSELIAVTNDSSIGQGDGHSAINNSDLSSGNDGSTELKELAVRVNATIVGSNTAALPDGTNLTSQESTTALIRVDNRGAALVGDVADGIGGQGSMQLESENVINETTNESVISNVSGSP